MVTDTPTQLSPEQAAPHVRAPRDREPASSGLPLPGPHFMLFAPLDVWCRMLFAPVPRVPLKYALRLWAWLFVSTLATVLTLPERIAFGLWFWLVPFRPQSLPGIVFVLGYYRSGTTHLHYLLNCDRQFFTPRWYHMLAPQGGPFSWLVLRWLAMPFISVKRPMDGMEFGVEYPAEDQFGVNNWSLASALPAMAVLPQMWDHYARFHDLDALTDAERRRFDRTERDLIRKLAWLANGRQLLLKSPSHTAHVEALQELFRDVPSVRFVHVARNPEKVLQSNVWMHSVFQENWNLQDAAPRDALQSRLADEYSASERRFLVSRAAMAPGQCVQVRIQDLHADPLGQLSQIYATWKLAWTPETASRVVEYLHAQSDFQPNQHRAWSAAERARFWPRIAWLVEAFRHDEPPAAKVALPPRIDLDCAPPRPWIAYVVMTLAAMAIVAIWSWSIAALSTAQMTGLNRLGWPLGLLLGAIAWRLAAAPSRTLAIYAMTLTALVVASVNLIHAGQSTAPGLAFTAATVNLHTLFWTGLGMFTAFGAAGRSGLRE